MRRHTTESSDISAGVRKARHKTGPDRIVACRHHDRDRLHLSFDGRSCHVGGRHDDVQLEAHQLPRDLRKPFSPGLAVTKFQDKSSPFDMAKLPHSLPEGLDITRCGRWTARKKVPDPRDLLRLLRLGYDRNSEQYHCNQDCWPRSFVHLIT